MQKKNISSLKLCSTMVILIRNSMTKRDKVLIYQDTFFKLNVSGYNGQVMFILNGIKKIQSYSRSRLNLR